ncbi:MAG: hypothetical protein O9262_12730, partial [Cyclobacteriaceae bacterium]|nr:hypothetical protein [Cyclobacteriaceae bacterium]
MKKILPLLFLVLISFVAISQKNSSQPLAVNFEVTPTSPIAATLRNYNSVITTSLNPFSAAEASRITNMEQARASRLAELSTKYLTLYNGL